MSKFLGTVNINTGPGGDEGGEIVLAPASTNTTVSGNVVLDVYQNKLRIYESSGNNRGAYIDLTSASNGVGSNLLAGGGGATTLDGLTDVTAPSPSNGDFLKWNGTAWVNDVIDLATDTTGNYVSSLVAGTGVTLSNNSGEAATPTVAIGQAVGTTSNVVFSSASLYGDTESYLYGGYLDIYTVSFSGGLPSSVMAGTVAAHPSGSGLLINGASGAPVYVDNLIGANTSEFLGPINVQAIREKVTDSTITSNVMTCNYTYGGIFYQGTAPSANFTVNVTNLPTDNGNAITVSVFVTQGSTGYYPSALQIAGTGQTIKWSGGTAPTPTSSSGKIDVFTFTLIRRSSAWTVLGSANLNY